MVSERVTEALAIRGDAPVLLALLGNRGAAFSESGRIVVAERALGLPDVFIAIDRRSDFGQAIVAAYERRAAGGIRVTAQGAPRLVDAEVAARAGEGDVERALALVAIEAQTRFGLALRLLTPDTLDSFVTVARAADLSWGTLVGLLLSQLGGTASAQQINECRRRFENMTRNEALRATRALTQTEARRAN
jgi:hypothetical protein